MQRLMQWKDLPAEQHGYEDGGGRLVRKVQKIKVTSLILGGIPCNNVSVTRILQCDN